ncbi:hypothetical protein KC19_VG072300 [Ceratodon purpureus]|uniref:Uncharacterized protein n=1 Tax=Ceratodon purpureus TaxID=3225 RepID=A0A8T0HMU2_CERPU|nr:hypothetical protein KC19_VG072300 [Ceratodon purpureus]
MYCMNPNTNVTVRRSLIDVQYIELQQRLSLLRGVCSVLIPSRDKLHQWTGNIMEHEWSKLPHRLVHIGNHNKLLQKDIAALSQRKPEQMVYHIRYFINKIPDCEDITKGPSNRKCRCGRWDVMDPAQDRTSTGLAISHIPATFFHRLSENCKF